MTELTPRCQPGDLAVIIRYPEAPENIGKIVHVIERWNGQSLVRDMEFIAPPKPVVCWVVEAQGSGLSFIAELAGRKFEKGFMRIGVLRDDFLRPIRPDAEVIESVEEAFA